MLSPDDDDVLDEWDDLLPDRTRGKPYERSVENDNDLRLMSE